MSESKHRVAAKAILGARAAERYDVKAARAYFNEALAGCHPQERPALRQMMKASLALAERRPDELKDAMEKLGQEAPSGRQLLLLRMMGLLIPPAERRDRRPHPRHRAPDPRAGDRAAGARLRDREADRASPFGGIGTGSAVFFGFLLVVIALGVLVFLGRRRQAKRAARPAALTRGGC